MSLETQKTKAGTYLYEYAAANLKRYPSAICI